MSGLPTHPFPVVLAAPSGTGKTTIAHALVTGEDRFVFSISATTRAPRPGEVERRAYDFVSEEEFSRMADAGELVEWARVHGNFYGTPRRNIDEARGRGEFVVLDIDVQGAHQIRERLPEAVLIFIFPPSGAALRSRLTGRGTERSEEVARRIRAAHAEFEEARHFDYLIVNDDLDRAVEEVRRIVAVEGFRPRRIDDFPSRVARLREEIDRELMSLRERDG